MNVFSSVSVGPLLLMLEAADLSFTLEFLAVAIISFQWPLGHPCSRHHSQECWASDLSFISLLTFVFHAALIDYPFLSLKFFISLPPTGPFILTSLHIKGWNSLLFIWRYFYVFHLRQHLLRNFSAYRTLDQISYKSTLYPCLLLFITRCISVLYILWAFIISLSQSQSLTFSFESFGHQDTDHVIIPHIQLPPCLSLEWPPPSSEPSLAFRPKHCDPSPLPLEIHPIAHFSSFPGGYFLPFLLQSEGTEAPQE